MESSWISESGESATISWECETDGAGLSGTGVELHRDGTWPERPQCLHVGVDLRRLDVWQRKFSDWRSRMENSALPMVKWVPSWDRQSSPSMRSVPCRRRTAARTVALDPSTEMQISTEPMGDCIPSDAWSQKDPVKGSAKRFSSNRKSGEMAVKAQLVPITAVTSKSLHLTDKYAMITVCNAKLESSKE